MVNAEVHKISLQKHKNRGIIKSMHACLKPPDHASDARQMIILIALIFLATEDDKHWLKSNKQYCKNVCTEFGIYLLECCAISN